MGTEPCAYGNLTCQPVLHVNISGQPMSLNLDLEPTQRKSVYVGVVARRSEKDRDFGTEVGVREAALQTAYETYVADLFYDGKNPTGAAELRLVPRQLAEHLLQPTIFQSLSLSLSLFLSLSLHVCV